MMADPDDISRSLGRVEGKLEALTKAAEEDRKSAAEWRRSVYRLLEEHTEQINQVRTDVAIAGEISAQARESAKNVGERLDDRMDEEIVPTIEEWKKLKAMGMGMIALAGMAGAAIVSGIWLLVTHFGDAIAAAIRGALRIP